MAKKMVYLIAPYTAKHEDPAVAQALTEARIAQMCVVDAKLMARGLHTVTPLYKHLLLQHVELPGDWEYWQEYSLNLIDRCDAVYVLMLDGWEESTGVQAEIKYARESKIQIVYLAPDGALVRSEN